METLAPACPQRANALTGLAFSLSFLASFLAAALLAGTAVHVHEQDKTGEIDRIFSWTLDIQLDNDRGGGGTLLSTPTDLLIWNEAPTSGRLGTFVTEKPHEPTGRR